jgi:hypothetical protein
MNNWNELQSTPKLLPPTVFERPNKSNDTSNSSTLEIEAYNESYAGVVRNDASQFSMLMSELEKLKTEIKKMRGENETLRHRNKDFMEQAQLYTEVTGHKQVRITALEELINSQTREIQQLKSNLIEESQNNLRKIKELDASYNEKIKTLQVKLQESEQEKKHYIDSTENQIERLIKENENLNVEQNSKIKSLMEENKSLIDKHEKQINELNGLLEKTKQQSKEAIESREIKINNLCEENRKNLQELESIRVYIASGAGVVDKAENAKERELLEQQIKELKNKNESLQNENLALQTRFKSINEILLIQETQLELKHSSSSNLAANDKKRAGLLTKWRNKVFELLVQLKSQELTCKLEKSNGEKSIENYLGRIENETNKNKILQNIIEDKKAEIVVLNSSNSMLTEQMNELKKRNELLERNSDEITQSSIQLKSFVDSLSKQYQNIENSFKLANKKLGNLEKRVEFAKSRLAIVKTLYSRKGANQKEELLNNANLFDMTNNLSSISGFINNFEINSLLPTSLEVNLSATQKQLQMQQNQEMNSEENELLKIELNKVTSERDLLAKKFETDIKALEEHIDKIKSEYEANIENMSKELGELKQLNIFKQNTIEQLNEKLKENENVHNEFLKQHELLQAKLNSLSAELDAEYEDKLKKNQADFADKLASMEEKLNEARREQTKAVVLMRQIERSSNREKERMESLLESCDSYYKDYVNKLQAKLALLEKEAKYSFISNNRQHTKPNELNSLKMSTFESMNSNLDYIDNQVHSHQWLIKTSSLNSNTNLGVNGENKTTKANVNEKLNPNNNPELTSIWLDSKNSLDESLNNVDYSSMNSKVIIEDSQDDSNHNNFHKGEEESINESGKNNEIMQQIRKILGNLELSDAEDEKDESSIHTQPNSNILYY